MKKVLGVSAFGLKDCVAQHRGRCHERDFYLADAVLPMNSFGRIRTGDEAEEERTHTGLFWPPEARIKPGEPLRRVPISYAWRALVEAGDRTVRWSIGRGVSFPLPCILSSHVESLVTDFLSERALPPYNSTVKKSPDTMTVVAIPDNLDEFGQEILLREFAKGLKETLLIWRPVAAALSWIDKVKEDFPSQMGKNDHIHVIYFGSDAVEFTTFRLREEKHKGLRYVMPLRDRPIDLPPITGMDWAGRLIEESFEGIDHGGFWQALTNFPEIWETLAGKVWNRELPRAWNRGQEWTWWNPSPDLHNKIYDTRAGICDTLRNIVRVSCKLGSHEGKHSGSIGETFRKMVRQMVELFPGNRLRGIIICGPLVSREIPSWLSDELATLSDLGLKVDGDLTEPKVGRLCLCSGCDDPVAEGAAIYGERVLNGQPTYLDTLPNYGIWTEIKNLGHESKWDFYPLIPERTEIEGGKEYVLPEPIDKLLVKSGSIKFPIIIKQGVAETCRQITTVLPSKLKTNCKVLIDARMKPASGFALVTIRSADGQNVFSSGSNITLNWGNMKEVPFPKPPKRKTSYGYPFIAAGKGRIHLDGNEINRLRDFLDQSVLPDGEINIDQIEFLNNRDSNFLLPWGWDRYTPKSFSIGMFGPFKTEKQDILEIAKEFGSILYRKYSEIYQTLTKQTLCKLIGYMYLYAPSEFISELKNAFCKKSIQYQNQVIAAGRTFFNVDHFESLVDSLISGPSYPDRFTQWYFWSFMRCLCYYAEPAMLNREKGQEVFKRLYLYLNFHKHDRAIPNVKKYCLCAVLFGLRLREVNPDFLHKKDPLREKLTDVITNMRTQLRFPPTMFIGTDIEPNPGDNLNKYVIRFLEHKDTEIDRKVAGGLATES